MREGWFERMNAAMAEVAKLDLGYEQGPHSFEPPASPELVAELAACVEDETLRLQMTTFYTMADGLMLADVHNSYWLFNLKRVLNPSEECPQRLYCDGRRVLVFGCDGGGNHLAVRLTSPPDVIYMRVSGVEDGIYFNDIVAEWESPPIRVLAPSFDDFLEQLLDDVEAFVRGDRDWAYMCQVR